MNTAHVGSIREGVSNEGRDRNKMFSSNARRRKTGGTVHRFELMREGRSMRSERITIDPEIHSGTPAFRDRLVAQGVVASGMPREEFRKIMRDDAQRWAAIISAAGIKTQ